MNEALMRRLCNVPGGTTVPESQRNLDLDTLLTSPENLSALLRWCQRGTEMVLQDGLLDVCEEHGTTVEVPRHSEFQRFLSESGFSQLGRPIRTTECIDAYRVWCESNGEEPAGLRVFGRLMNRFGFRRRKTGGLEYYEASTLLN